MQQRFRARLNPQRPNADLLRAAYANGIFPMADPDTGRIDFYCPDPRGIIPLDPPEAFHIPKNLAREVRRERFDIRCDTAFETVMRECAGARSLDNESWMTEPLLRAYVELFEQGEAHSIEAWLHGRLVGGLYGVHLAGGGAFFGESMFSRPALGGSNASKVCLIHLVNWLRRRRFTLLDTQFQSEHLAQFGCIEVSRMEYMRRLAQALNPRRPVEWGRFEVSASA